MREKVSVECTKKEYDRFMKCAQALANYPCARCGIPRDRCDKTDYCAKLKEFQSKWAKYVLPVDVYKGALKELAEEKLAITDLQARVDVLVAELNARKANIRRLESSITFIDVKKPKEVDDDELYDRDDFLLT